MELVVGQEIEAGTTDEIKLFVTDIADGINEPIDHVVKVTAGSWQFGKNSVHEDAHSYDTTDGNNLVIIRCYPGQLCGKASSGTDSLVIT